MLKENHFTITYNSKLKKYLCFQKNKLHRGKYSHFKEDTYNIICHKSQRINLARRNLAIFLLSKIHSSTAVAIDKVAHQLYLVLKEIHCSGKFNGPVLAPIFSSCFLQSFHVI